MLQIGVDYHRAFRRGVLLLSGYSWKLQKKREMSDKTQVM
jgi:hypothetical protein